jgi:Family of unknown function (DUF5906)
MNANPSPKSMTDVVVTIFPDNKGQRIVGDKSMLLPLIELEQLIRTTKARPLKNNLALLKFATFGSKKSAAGCLRTDDNVVEITGIEGDYDGEVMTMAEAVERLKSRGIEALLYTSASHTPEKPRWRVLCRLEIPFSGTPDEMRIRRARWVGVLNAILGGGLKSESFALSQSFYFGPLQGKPEPEVVRLEGVCIDEMSSPPAPVYAPTTVVHLNPRQDRSKDLMTKVSADVRTAIHTRHDGHPHAADTTDPERAVDRCIDKAAKYWGAEGAGQKAEQLSVEDMLKRFVYVAREPIIVDLSNVSIKWRPHAFHGKYAASIEGSGKNAAPASRLWAAHPNRSDTYDIGFDPSEPRFFQHGGKTLLNMWTEPEWPDVDVVHAQPFIGHLEFLIPDSKSRNDLLDWLAATAQQPGIRPHYHFLLLAEPEGTGRSWLGDALREIWSNDYAISVDMHRLLDDNFNSELSRKVIVYVNEIKATANERFNHRERLKSLLSDSWITVNEKSLARWVEKFCARFLMFTNSTAALPITEKDRRIYAVRCTSTVRTPDYYKQLYKRLSDRQFLAAVWKLLKTRDLRNYNPGAVAPLTNTKLEMAEDGRTSGQQAAVEFARLAPFDVIHAPDLYKMVVVDRDHEPEKDRQNRLAAITNALRDVGVTPATRKMRPVEKIPGGEEYGRPSRVWILRNPDQWRDATTEMLRIEVTQAREELEKHRWKLDAALGAWSEDPTTDPTESGY